MHLLFANITQGYNIHSMETKKTSRADLESRRAQGFLLGLVFVLALMFVGFEYSIVEDDSDADIEGLEDFLRDVELAPVVEEQKDMMLLPEDEDKPQVAEKINVVDEEVVAEEPEEQTPKELEAEPEDQEVLPEVKDMDEKVLDQQIAEELPQFPGGAIALMKWLTKNLHYPQYAQQKHIQGKVVVQFIVAENGVVRDINIVEKLEPSCDREALRVMRMMPRWKAGTKDNKPCRSMVCIPIVFKI